MLLGKLRIRGKFTVLVVLPLLAVLLLLVPVAGAGLRSVDRASDAAAAVEVADRVAHLISEIQAERLLAVGFLLKIVSAEQVQQQSEAVTERAAELTLKAAQKESDLPPKVEAALIGVEKLAPLRAGVQSGITAPDKLIGGYGEVVTALLDSLELERGVDASTSVGRQVIALDAAMRIDELITAGAGYLLIAAATKKPEILVPYFANLAVIESQVDRLDDFATPAQIDLYRKTQAEMNKDLGTTFVASSQVNPIEALAQVPLATLFNALRELVGPSHGVSHQITEDVIDQTGDEERSALIGTSLLVGGALLVALLTTLLSVAVARAVVRPLSRLTSSADRVARLTEAELTRVADDETEAPGEVQLEPIEVETEDEIGELALAFRRVQTTAVGLVERQVASRRNVAQMFGHVGRRTQNLVNRQLAVIDQLEDEETVPERLQHLYRLDHISSRLRRNAGSLVVLSGATSANEHLNPVSLADVVRLALAEIEGYTRVDVLVPPDVVLVPAVVNDVVLVIAELMENATAFSPPHTRVTVNARATPVGAQLAVVDHGIGMAEDQLAQENARLERRERLDLAPTGVLGLFVVGRLARRHGLRVLLGTTPGGGLTATVDIPREMVASGVPAAPVPAALPLQSVPPLQAPVPLQSAPPLQAPVPARAQPPVPGPAQAPIQAPIQAPGAAPQVWPVAPVNVEFRAAPADPAAGNGSFDRQAVSRASELIAGGTTWSAFAPRQRVDDHPTAVIPVIKDGPPTAPPEDVPAGVRLAHGETQALPIAGAAPPRMPAAVTPMPVSAPLIPSAAPPMPPMPPMPQPATAPPVSAVLASPGRAPLTRRQPGATLAGQPDNFPPPGPALQPPDPDEARQLVEQFEAGVVRALGEVRSHHQREEGSPR